MIMETNSAAALAAMNSAFEAAYRVADDPRVARNPAVVAARATAEAAHASAVDAVRAAQAANGFLRTMKANIVVSRASYAASVAEVALRAAIRNALKGGGYMMAVTDIRDLATRGMANFEKAQYDPAIADFNEVIRLDSKNAGGYFLRAHTQTEG